MFAFSGAVDTATLCAIVQHVERMAHSVPESCAVDVIAVRLDAPLLHDLLAVMRRLRRAGLCTRLGVGLPRRAPRVRIAPPALTSDPTVVFH